MKIKKECNGPSHESVELDIINNVCDQNATIFSNHSAFTSILVKEESKTEPLNGPFSEILHVGHAMHYDSSSRAVADALSAFSSDMEGRYNFCDANNANDSQRNGSWRLDYVNTDEAQ